MSMPYTVLWVIFRFWLLLMDSFRSSRWPSLSSFFRSCPAPVFRIYDPTLNVLTIPVLFRIILCCFRSNFGSSVLCPVYMYCVLYLAFLHVAIFFLFAVLPGFCLSVLAMYFVLSSTLQTPPFLLNWYQKTKFTSLRQYHFICICEGGGGRGQGGPWPMGDSGSCSGVLKYAVTWYCISTFTSLHRGLEGWGGGGESGETRIEWCGEDRDEF